MSDEFTIPGGKERGKPLREASPQTIRYWLKVFSEELESGQARNPEYAKKRIAAFKAALGAGPVQPRTQRTAAAAAPAAPAQGQALARANPETLMRLQGAFSTPDSVMGMMRAAQEVAHLISPQTACGELTIGTAIATSMVAINLERDTYPIPGKIPKRGLDKTALEQIASAAGVDWVESRRTDNGAHPHLCSWVAVAEVKNFDGTPRRLIGSLTIDLRDSTLELERQRATEDPDYPLPPGGKELSFQRKFIDRLAESKAMNRAIRRLGVRTAYTNDELQKPFVVVKVAFTGRVDDPDLKRLAFEKTFEAFHGRRGAPALYAPQAPVVHETLHSSPSHHDVEPDDDSFDGYDYDYDHDDNEPAALTDGQLVNELDQVKAPAQQELKT